MPTKMELQNGSSRHQFGRTMQRELSAGPHALISSVSSTSAPRDFTRNAIIYEQGQPAGQLYKITSGAVRTCNVLSDGRRQIGAFYLPGDMFGLETEEQHLFSAEAVIDSKVLMIERPTSPFARSDKVGSQMWTALTRRELKRAQDHLLLLSKTALERVVSFLLEMVERLRFSDRVELPMPRRDIADYLGLTIETVSRVLTQLENESAIELLTSKQIVLRKQAALRRLLA
jgi:CRP/FNR family transcriptional regulator, nitrogen fixation regulation protein